jgi:(p)ppGpp synthase/HD superfamily hydrolase
MKAHPTLAETIALSRELHGGDVDKGGFPYWTHPLRVLIRLGPNADEVEKQAALLHDTVEDTGITQLYLARKGYGPRVIHVVSLLTHEPGISQRGYVDRLCQSGNKWAIRTKLADVYDNMAPFRRSLVPAETTIHGEKKYPPLIARLEKALIEAHGQSASDLPVSGDPAPDRRRGSPT